MLPGILILNLQRKSGVLDLIAGAIRRSTSWVPTKLLSIAIRVSMVAVVFNLAPERGLKILRLVLDDSKCIASLDEL